METRIFGTSEEEIMQAAQIIRDGGLVAFPTETVYGLGANALDEEAVARVYKAKGRPSDNPMIVHIASKKSLNKLTFTVTEAMEKLMDAFWPGPLTMVVKARPEIPRITTGGLDTVAVRMPDNQHALKLISEAQLPLAGPSANLSGRPSPTTSSHVYDDLHGRIEAIIEGESCKVGIESTVVDMTCDEAVVLRPGIITAEELAQVLGERVSVDPAICKKPDIERGKGLLETDDSFRPKSPGMKYKHYAPKADMLIFKGPADRVKEAMAEEKIRREAGGQKVGILIYDSENPAQAAHDFFAQIRAMDKSGIEVILVSALEEEGVGFAVMNRMFKSAGYNIKEV